MLWRFRMLVTSFSLISCSIELLCGKENSLRKKGMLVIEAKRGGVDPRLQKKWRALHMRNEHTRSEL